MEHENFKKYIINVDDFPKKGVHFKDITPLLNNENALKQTIDEFVKLAKNFDFNVILAPESRGFIFAITVAYLLNKRVILVRKEGKLPRKTYNFQTSAEYDSPILQIHIDDLNKTDRVIIVDDVFATGGTCKAIKNAVDYLGAKFIGGIFLIKLNEFADKENFYRDCGFKSLVEY